MRALAISLAIALCTTAPPLYAQFTVGGMGASMGMMGGLQGMGSNAGAIGMGAVNGMQMGGMGGGQMFRYTSVNPHLVRRQTGMTTVRATLSRPRPAMVEWRRTLRLRQPILFNWN